MDVSPSATIRLNVDATDTDRGIFRVTEIIPLVSGAPFVLTMAKWLPAYHAPRGAIDFLAGFEFTAGGQQCAWTRDPLDPFRLAIDVPDGATEITAVFQGLTPTDSWQGRVVVSDDMLRLDWSAVCLYPAGANVDQVIVYPTLALPEGWIWATALDENGADGAHLTFAPVDLRRLLDSPVMAGRHAHVEVLDPAIRLTIVADRPDQLPLDPAVLDCYRRLIAEADALFGSRPFSRYDFLMSVSDQTGSLGLEHRASSECGVRSTHFSDWDVSTTEHDLLPHEFVHAWVGKYRVPQGNLHADLSCMTDELMWVYEGLTQYYGHVLAARCGLISASQTRDAFALIFTTYDTRAGRRWRPLADTDMDPIFSGRKPQPWTSWQRSEDYYSEGLLIWLEIDAMIRRATGSKRSLDDLCRTFFAPSAAVGSNAPASPYGRREIVAALNAVMPHDWDEHFASRINRIAPRAPFAGISMGGYDLAWQTFPSDWLARDHEHFGYFDFSYSIGLKVGLGARIIDVMWDGPAFHAGLARGSEIIAVGDRAYSTAALQNAIDLARTGGQPIVLTVRRFDRVKQAVIHWTGGQRYPALRPLADENGPRHLDAILAPRAILAEERNV